VFCRYLHRARHLAPQAATGREPSPRWCWWILENLASNRLGEDKWWPSGNEVTFGAARARLQGVLGARQMFPWSPHNFGSLST
jgi:hypothetical protein